MKKLLVSLLALALAVSAASARNRFSVLGDSYSAFPGDVTPATNDCWYGTKGTVEKGTTDVTDLSQCWWRILCDKYGYELDTNNSFSGSTVGFTGYGGADYSDFGFLSRMHNLGNPDIIFVFGGTNDAWIPAPIGDYAFSGWSKQDLYAFRPAFAKLLSQLRELYPDARIVNILNSELGEDVPASVAEICRHYDVGNIVLKDIDKLTGHPSVKGMEAIADQIHAYMLRNSGVSLFPLPRLVEVGDGSFTLRPAKVTVSCPEQYGSAPLMLAELLGKGYNVKRVKKHADVTVRAESTVAPGGYTLNVAKRGVEIAASDYEGVAAGISSLVQLLPPEAIAGNPLAEYDIPCMYVSDAPKYGWRGLLFDSSRHFWTVDEAKKQLKTMALFKLNKFHWHLTDSQEWRIPMDQYPQFEMGCYRPLDGYIDEGVFKRSRDTGNPDFDFPTDHRMRLTQPGDTVYGGEFSAIMRISEGGDTIYGGHYTREDIAEIIDYAAMLGIEVVPEIDMPGHFRGASKLLPWLSCDYVPFAALCPGRDSSLDFCKHVLTEVFGMFPSKKIHIGGDEVDRSHWRTCPDCIRRADSLGLESTDQLQAWFVREMAQFVHDNGHEVIGWQEIADDGFEDGTQATIMWWLGEDPGVVKRAIAKGFDVICCPRQVVYLDYEENSKSLGKILNLRPSEYCGGRDALGHVKGMQGNMWTEWVPSIQRLEYMVWPRLMAISHMGWTETTLPVEDYYALAAPQFMRLDAYGLNYHVPDLEGFEEHNVLDGTATLSIVNRLPYIPVRYTTDGTVPTLDSPLYTGPIQVTAPSHFRVGSFRPDGRCIKVFDIYYDYPEDDKINEN